METGGDRTRVLLVGRYSVTHPFNPDPRVVASGDTRTGGGAVRPLTDWRAMTHRISVSVTQICNCVAALPCRVSILASRHFFPAITERNSSLCDGFNVWPFLAF